MNRWVSTAVLLGTVAAVTQPVAAAEPAGLQEFYGQQAQWGRCVDFGRPIEGLQCATLVVPMNYRKPGAERISLTISRMPAKDPAKRKGALMLIPGGPGGSGLLLPYWDAERPIGQVYDLVSFDPRGVGESTQLHCEGGAPVGEVSSRPTDDQFELFTARARMAEAECERAGGGLRPYVNTPNIARDMDVIRGVLGEQKINFVGTSYGSYVAAVYGSLFPNKVNRNVFDSAVHPDEIWRGTWRSQAVAARANVDALFTWLGERNSVYGLGKSHAEVYASSRALAAKLIEKPIINPDNGETMTITHYDRFVLGFLSRARSAWDYLGRQIKTFKAIAEGTIAADSPAAKDATDAAAVVREFAIPRTREGVFDTVRCEADWPQDLSFYYNEMKVFREEYPYWDGVAKVAPNNCTFRSFTPPDKVTELKRAGYPTGVVIQAEGDTNTAYAGGPAMASKLRNHLISVADDGTHDLYGYNPCVNELVDRYLIDGVLPGTRVTCPGAQRPDIPADNAETVSRRAVPQPNLTEFARRFVAEEQNRRGGF
ncbi:alpha/beta fold hydrolase [Kibdelosporangium philippinense]|uniref:alpha/beta fold hydrolase n=1 Tax=Kibdelosporangium philippinense TaxID=211113 RepID=UPI0036093512